MELIKLTPCTGVIFFCSYFNSKKRVILTPKVVTLPYSRVILTPLLVGVVLTPDLELNLGLK